MTPSLTTFLFEAANFAAVAALLAWLFFKPVRQALRQQREDIERQAQESSRQLDEARQLRAELEFKRQHLGDELQELRKQALESARHEADELVHAARVRMAKEREAQTREVASIKRAEAAQLTRVVVRVTRDAVTNLLREIKGPELHESLIRAATRELAGESPYQDVTIESAESLNADSLRRLAEALGTAPDAIQQRVNPELLAGVRVQTSRGLVDATVTGLARYAENELSSLLMRERDESDV